MEGGKKVFGEKVLIEIAGETIKPIPSSTEIRFTTEQLFPGWAMAHDLLLDFCEKIAWPDVSTDKPNNTISINPVLPTCSDELSGERVPAYMTFPPEHRDKVVAILINVVSKYIPHENLERFKKELINEQTLQAVESELIHYEQSIIAAGGRSFMDELKANLGVLSII